jgi:3-hydroxymyristoyl/3-hydroxydecanoyl-(acyl carrier protein) dehydratase
MLKVVRGVGKFKCRATVDGRLAAEAEVLAVLKS